MKIKFPQKLFTLAFLVLIVTNFVVLLGVYENRSGEVDSQLILTERELRLFYSSNEENSGLSLNILWQSLGKHNIVHYSGWQAPTWLNTQKLQSLGFDIDQIIQKSDQSYYSISKESFIVLEYDGDTYQEALKRVKKDIEEKKRTLDSNPQDKQLQSYYKIAEKSLQTRNKFESRLYAIDVGNDPEKLREKYSDRSKYIITKALIALNYDHITKEPYGSITGLSISQINIPLKFRKVFNPIIKKDILKRKKSRMYHHTLQQLPRFQMELAYGKRFEPWIVSLRVLENNTSIQNK